MQIQGIYAALATESRGQRLLLWGAIVHTAEVQFADPAVTIDYDVDPAQAVATRRHVLEDAARQGYLVGGAHPSFPGIGHVAPIVADMPGRRRRTRRNREQLNIARIKEILDS